MVLNYILIGCPWLKGCLIISVPRTCYIHVGVCFIKVPMYSIMQSHYFKHFHCKLLSQNCQNKEMKSFDADDSPLEQTLLTLPVWSKNWRNKENKNMSQEGHSSIVVMKRWGGLREASKKNPWWWWVLCQNKIPRGVYKVQYWFYTGFSIDWLLPTVELVATYFAFYLLLFPS